MNYPRDSLSALMRTEQRYGNRVAMWHEAGHAVVAMHFGARVHYYGLSPLPHCLVNSLRLSKHEKGVLLCAGAAMTVLMYGYEWGADASDYKMAETFGDLDVFKAEALALCAKLMPEAKYLVQSRLGRDVRPAHVDPGFWGEHDVEDDVADMTELSPHYAACVKAAEKGVMPEWLKKTVMSFARFQMKRPAFVAKHFGV